MAVRYVSSQSSQPLTLNQLIAAPLVIPERIISVLAGQFVMDQILRGGYEAPGGAGQFRVASGLFADQPSSVVAPRAEIPLATFLKGDLQTAPTTVNALGISFDTAMMEMDVTGELLRQEKALKNTITRDVDGKFLAAVLAAVTQTVTAANPWANSAATIRKNINAAKLLIQLSVAPGTTGTGSSASYEMYNPDTLLVNPNTEADLLNSTEFLQMIFGQINSTNIGAGDFASLPNGGNVLGLTPMASVSVPAGKALVCERKTLGGYADRVPMTVSELYEWAPARLWRSDAFRESVAFVDSPGAGCWINSI